MGFLVSYLEREPQNPWHRSPATADRYLSFLDPLSHITWRIRVAHQVSGHTVGGLSFLPG